MSRVAERIWRQYRSSKATQYATFEMLVQDLDFVVNCCRWLRAEHCNPDVVMLAIAVWRAAIITYGRCFKRAKGRPHLDPVALFSHLQGEPLRCHDELIRRRDKLVAHADGAYERGEVAVLLGEDGGVEAVKLLSLTLAFDDPQGIWNLGAFATAARDHCRAERDRLHRAVFDELERLPIGERRALEEFEMAVPGGAHQP